MPWKTRIRRTSVVALGLGFGTSKLDIDEVNLELLLGIDTNQERTTTAGGDNFVRIVGGLEDECERALKLLRHSLDELSEAETLIGLRVVDVLCQNRDCLCVGLTLKLVTALLQDETKSSSIGDDTVVDDDELVGGVRADWVAVDVRGRAVGGPASVSDGNLGRERLRSVHGRLGDGLAETSHLTDVLVEEDLALLVAIDTDTARVVPAILLAGKTIAKDLDDLLAFLQNQTMRSASVDQPDDRKPAERDS